jgi:pimeloyl-ACP methyl ester carboxylesterase
MRELIRLSSIILFIPYFNYAGGYDIINRKISIIQFGDTSLEYSVTGEGSPILLFHGSHSSCLEEFGYQRLLASGYSIITPSRAGYGRTSAISDLGQACTIYKLLLDHLNLEKVHVIAVSAGGPTGILFCSNLKNVCWIRGATSFGLENTLPNMMMHS